MDLRKTLLSRREFALLAAASTASLVASPCFARAGSLEIRRISARKGYTWGEFTRETDPDYWAFLNPKIKSDLDSLVMFGDEAREEALASRGVVGGSTWLTAYGGVGSSYYSCSYSATVNCPQLYLQVAYEKGGEIYAYGAPFYAENTNVVRGSGTVYLPTGTYNVTALGYAIVPPSGYEVSYHRDFATATVS